MAMIDPGIVLQLVSTRFSAQAGTLVDLLLPGDPDPEQTEGAAKPFMRLIDIDLSPDKTERSNNEDSDTSRPQTGSISLAALVMVPEEVSRRSFGAVGQAVGICAAALAGCTLRDSGTGHQVDIDAGPRMKLMAQAESARGVLVGTVMWSGTVSRDSGRSIAAFM